MTATSPHPTTQGRSVTTDRVPEARLLVVDDEPNILELLSASLRFAGFEVTTATNGARGARRGPASAGPTWSCST